MSVEILLWVVLAAVFVSVALSYVLKVNLGIPAMIFAYIIGVWVQGMKVKEVVACWPTSTVFQLMTITMFFSFAVFNGTLPKVAQNVVYALRHKPYIIPFALLAIGGIIGAMGAPPPACNTILAVLTFTVAAPAGMNPWLCAVVVCFGGSVGTFFPWAVQGSVVKATTEGWLPGMGEAAAYKVCLGFFVFTMVLFLLFWILTKGYKIKEIQIEKPEPFTAVQKKNLAVIGVIAALAIVPNLLKLFISSPILKKASSALDIQMLAIIGVFVCTVLGLGKEKDAIVKGVPWNTIIMVGGVCTLMGVAGAAGVTDYLGGLLSENVSPVMMGAIMALLGGFMSLFSGAINAVFPMLGALAIPYAAAAGIDPVPLLVAVAVGASATAISPFSTGGAIMIANCPDQKIAEGLFTKCIVLAVLGAAVCAVLSLVGVFAI